MHAHFSHPSASEGWDILEAQLTSSTSRRDSSDLAAASVRQDSQAKAPISCGRPERNRPRLCIQGRGCIVACVPRQQCFYEAYWAQLHNSARYRCEPHRLEGRSRYRALWLSFQSQSQQETGKPESLRELRPFRSSAYRSGETRPYWSDGRT